MYTSKIEVYELTEEQERHGDNYGYGSILDVIRNCASVRHPDEELEMNFVTLISLGPNPEQTATSRTAVVVTFK